MTMTNAAVAAVAHAPVVAEAWLPKVKAVLEDEREKMQGARDLPSDERREKMRAVREAGDKKLKEILTAEQWAKYEKMPRPGRGGGKKGGGEKKENQ